VKPPQQAPATHADDDVILKSKLPDDFSQLLSKTIDHVVPIPPPKKPSRRNRERINTHNLQEPNQVLQPLEGIAYLFLISEIRLCGMQDNIDYFPPITQQQQEAIRYFRALIGRASILHRIVL
jgi:hypothetical protein